MSEEKREVRIVEARGKSALVEWEDGGRLRRAFVPAKEVVDGACPAGVLEEAPAYGVPWELVDLSAVTPEAVAEQLRRRGIWTPADLRAKDRVLIRIATDAIGDAVWRAAKAAEQKGGSK